MTDHSALQRERDQELITELVQAAKNLRRGFEEWIQSELKDCLYRLDFLEPTLPSNLRPQAQSSIRRMRDINQIELPEAIRNIDQRMSEIRQGTYTDLRDAHRWLQDGMSRFDMLVFELIEIRRFLQSYDPDDATGAIGSDDDSDE